MGIVLETIHGSWRVGLIYCAFNFSLVLGVDFILSFTDYYFAIGVGVYTGAMNCAISDPYSIVVGASGGVYTIIGMHISNLILNWFSMTRGLWNHWVVFIFLCLLAAIETYEVNLGYFFFFFICLLLLYSITYTHGVNQTADGRHSFCHDIIRSPLWRLYSGNYLWSFASSSPFALIDT